MSATRRSVWEVRFMALRRSIIEQSDLQKHNLANKALSDSLTDESIVKTKASLCMTEKLLYRANDLMQKKVEWMHWEE